jgi:dTDP-4-amino-4,6-dideoxygalactose transaminase
MQKEYKRETSVFSEESVLLAHEVLNKAVSEGNHLSGITGEGVIREFEEKFRRIFGGKFAIALTNCTSAILTALTASGIGYGDEVILPVLTWGQTLAPVLAVGATPVFADIKNNSLSINPKSVEKLITKNTKAIIGVHLHKIPSDITELQNLCKKHKLKLIFDSAQCFEAYGGKPIGNYGDFVAFSFGRNKEITTGEGGMLICNNRNFYEKAILVSQHPLRAHKAIDNTKRRFTIDSVCLNFRMHPLAAALGIGQIDFYADKKRRINKNARARLFSLMYKNNIKKCISYKPEIVFVTDEKRVSSLQKLFSMPGVTVQIEKPLLLNLSESIKSSNFNGRKINHHYTHSAGSCPVAEELSGKYIFKLNVDDEGGII